MFLEFTPLLAAGSLTSHILAWVLMIGAGVLTVGFGALIWTRWGEARPLAKCVGLSVFAHILLLFYAYGTRIFFNAPPRLGNGHSEIRVSDLAIEEEDAAPPSDAPQVPWDQLTAKDLDTQLPEKSAEEAEPAQEAAPAEPSPMIVRKEPPPLLPPEETPPETEKPAEEVIPAPEQVASQPSEGDAPENDPNSSPLEDPSVAQPSEPGQENETTPVAAENATPRRAADGSEMPVTLRTRVAADRIKIGRHFGATADTETAVNAALEWLAANQSKDGRWDADLHGAGRAAISVSNAQATFGSRGNGQNRGQPLLVESLAPPKGTGARADTGVTGLALLAFLGNGETHWEGAHRETVQHGLEFLLNSQAANGSFAGEAELFASMYCHGIASLAVCEAYAMTGDDRLKEAVQKAIHYTTTAQHAGGGWRYQPNDPGDMSQFGWQLMSLKSAEMSGIKIPDEVRTRMAKFLRSCSLGNQRGLAGYRPGDRPTRTMTAEALACRIFLGAENSEGTQAEAAAYILEELPSSGTPNYYYWYYGSVSLFQRQGSDWQQWNQAMTSQILSRQRPDGPGRGSWDPTEMWGGYGGRVYTTAMATLCLEVYYRYLPLYGASSPEEAPSRLTEQPVPGISR